MQKKREDVKKKALEERRMRQQEKKQVYSWSRFGQQIDLCMCGSVSDSEPLVGLVDINSNFTLLTYLRYGSRCESSIGNFIRLTVTVVHNCPVWVSFSGRLGFHLAIIYLYLKMKMRDLYSCQVSILIHN